MKKRLCIMLILIISLVFGNIIQCFADAVAYDMKPASYYVYVKTPDGGLNMRHGPGTDYGKVMNETIPDGIKLYISYVSENWGYTEYNGYSGWVALKQTVVAADVDSNKPYMQKKAGYNVYVAAPDGGVNMRTGPDKSYSKVMQEIVPNGIKIYIEYVSGNWGYGAYNGYEGWVYLPQTTTNDPAGNVLQDNKEEPLLEKEEPKEEEVITSDTKEVNEDEAVETSQKNDEKKENKSMLSQMMLGIILILVVVIISIVILVVVNSNTRR